MHLNRLSVRAIVLITIVTEVLGLDIHLNSYNNRRRRRFASFDYTSNKNPAKKSVPFPLPDFGFNFRPLISHKIPQNDATAHRRIERDTTDPPKQFTIKDVTVPPDFLRVEYMIGYTFMGTMYGLGFLVLFQCLLVPLTKGLVALLYMWFLWLEVIEPVTLEEALQQIPPSK